MSITVHPCRAGAVLWLGVFLLLSVPFLRGEPTSARTTLSFESHGKTIRVDVFEPVSFATYGDALVLHGAGGVLFDGPEMHRMARQLASSGVRAYVIHYFDGSGVAFTTHDAVLRAHHDEWLAVVRGRGGVGETPTSATLSPGRCLRVFNGCLPRDRS